MHSILNTRTEKALLLFTILAFSLTWTIAFWIYYLLSHNMVDERQQQLMHALGALGPTIGAFITAYICYGKNGVSQLFQKLRPSRQQFSKNLSILSTPILLFLISLVAYRFSQGGWYDFPHFIKTNWGTVSNTIIWFSPLVSYAIFEEIGWRGFLLPHLQDRHNAWTATVYLSIIWAFWHLPFFFYRFDFSPFIAVGFFFGLFVGAIILTSLYNTSHGTLWPVILFHLLMNIASGFDKEIIVAVLSTGYIFLAIYIYRKYGKEHLSTVTRTKNYFVNSSD